MKNGNLLSHPSFWNQNIAVSVFKDGLISNPDDKTEFCDETILMLMVVSLIWLPFWIASEWWGCGTKMGSHIVTGGAR
jgi:hypothetical protein